MKDKTERLLQTYNQSCLHHSVSGSAIVYSGLTWKLGFWNFRQKSNITGWRLAFIFTLCRPQFKPNLEIVWQGGKC